MCVPYQLLKTHAEWEWTLLCLLYIGMVNITQWLFDSLLHKVTSPIAFPELVIFFEEQVGGALGIIVSPFFHLYELHVYMLEFLPVIFST